MRKATSKCVSWVLALVLLAALVPAAAYSDLSGHWAEEYMEELAEKGFLSGYEDGTMRPDSTLTICEALVILSRFYPTDDEANAWISYDYGAVLDASLPAALSWARSALGVCLAAGIVKESEIKKLDLRAAAEKEELAVFLVRALRLTAEATSMASAELSFTDAEQITLSYRGYVSVLAKAGIASGDDKGAFGPHQSVTRAMTAAMVSKALAYLKSAGSTLTLPDYQGVTRVEGFLAELGEDFLCLRTYAGPVCRYARGSSAPILVGAAECKLNADYLGCAVTAYIRDGAAVKLATDSAGTYTWVSGSVSASHVSQQDFVSSYVTIGESYYSPLADVAVYLNDKPAAFSSVSASDYAVLKLSGGRISRLYAYSTPITVTGTISRLQYAATVDLRVTDEAGVVWTFPLRISSLPAITHGGTTISLDRLSVDDEVLITMQGSTVKSIALVDTVEYVSGVLTSVLTSADGTQWFLSRADGAEAGYLLEETAGAYNGGAAILPSEVGIGAEVTLSVAGGRVIKIELLAAAPSETKVSGTVLGADSAGVLTLFSGGRLVYVETKSAVLLSAKTGKNVAAADIAENAAATAYGTFSTSNRIAATVVVVE